MPPPPVQKRWAFPEAVTHHLIGICLRQKADHTERGVYEFSLKKLQIDYSRNQSKVRGLIYIYIDSPNQVPRLRAEV